MKVVLLKDVPKVGHRRDVKNVADGFALNYLIPQGLAETATDKVIMRVEAELAKEAVQQKIKQDLLLKNFGDLKGIIVTMERIANKEGHLFAAIHTNEIAEAIKEQTRLDVESSFIQTEPIKSVGEHEIEVKIGDRAVKFTLIVKGLDEEHKSPVKEKAIKAKSKTKKS